MADFADLTPSQGLEEALRAAEHLTPADAAAVAVAREMASRLDSGNDYTVQVFLQSLNALNLTAASRMAAAIKDTGKRSKIADMKAERERRGRASA